ncbi:MAG: response regulator [Elusimicrobiales bacterium]|nr:response regulator [Elusimicrobiales bacterium]
MAKILIIDDDPDIVESMRIILESCRHKVKVAKNGAEGLKEAKAAKYDLIILDVMMETMSTGFEVARGLRESRENKTVPILMLTAIKESTGLDFNSEVGDKDWLPVNAYLEKPLKPNELLVKVEALLKGDAPKGK